MLTRQCSAMAFNDAAPAFANFARWVGRIIKRTDYSSLFPPNSLLHSGEDKGVRLRGNLRLPTTRAAYDGTTDYRATVDRLVER